MKQRARRNPRGARRSRPRPAEEGRTKEEAEQVEFDELGDSIKTIDRELVDLRELEKTNKAAAVAVVGTDQKAAATTRSGVRVENVKRNLPPRASRSRGIAIAKAVSFKEMIPAHEIAKATLAGSRRTADWS